VYRPTNEREMDIVNVLQLKIHRILMPCFCRVFAVFFTIFFQSMPCFFHFFAVIFYCP